jgi:hypothetical protein
MKTRRLVLIPVLFFCSLLSYGLDRQAFTFTSYNLKVKVDPAKGGFAAAGTLQARNDSNLPERNLVLQISGTLAWSSVKIGDQEVPWVQQQYTSDIDHCGELSEAILTFSKPVAPGAYVNVSFAYDGTIPLNTGRLLRVNTPGTYAAKTDWDRISDSFSAVRGLGYVVWYPVAMDSVTLADGPAVWDAIAAWNQRHRASSLKADFTVPAGQQLVSNADSSQILADGTVELNYASLGVHAPTFVLGTFTKTERPGMTIYSLPDHTQLARDYVNAAEKVTPEMSDWFGTPKTKLTVIELSDSEVLPYDDGSTFFFTPLLQIQEQGLEMMMAHQIVHTIIQSPRPWIQEGLAYLGQLLVHEKQGGRDQALLFLHQFNAPLADIEKADLQAGKPQPLATSNDQLLYRAKGAYVWFMLRDLAGDDQLSAAIKNYRAALDTQPNYMQSLIEAQMKQKGSLELFFDNWVSHDKGLADFRIDSVYPRNTLGTNYVVTVTVENLGEAGANAIVLVDSGQGERAEHTWVSAKSKAVIRVAYPGVPQKVLVNDGSVPEWNLDNNEYEIKNLPKPSE